MGLTHYKNKQGGISSSLAWDDLTNVKLDAGEVVEARTKEVTSVRDKRVYDRIPRQQALRHKWKIRQTRWIYINKRDYVTRSIGVDSSVRSSIMNRWTDCSLERFRSRHSYS